MLVLSRQQDETIMIGDDIEITVVDIRGDKVRLGISAPSRIAVHRKEVYLSIIRENEQAAKIDDPSSDQLTVPVPLPALAGSVAPISPGPGRLRVTSLAPNPGPPRLAPGSPRTTPGAVTASKVPRAGPLQASDARVSPPQQRSGGVRKAV
jgi:carbon storage regulator